MYIEKKTNRNVHGGGVMLHVHKDISHMLITELENDSVAIAVYFFWLPLPGDCRVTDEALLAETT